MITDLLTDSCVIQKRTLDTSGRTNTETWSGSASTACRVLKSAISSANSPKTQHATTIRTRFVFSLSVDVDLRDRILHESRVYEVIEVVTPHDATGQHHKIAVCEGVAGAV